MFLNYTYVLFSTISFRLIYLNFSNIKFHAIDNDHNLFYINRKNSISTWNTLIPYMSLNHKTDMITTLNSSPDFNALNIPEHCNSINES